MTEFLYMLLELLQMYAALFAVPAFLIALPHALDRLRWWREDRAKAKMEGTWH